MQSDCDGHGGGDTMKVGDLIYNSTHDIRGLLIDWHSSSGGGTIQYWWVLYADGVLDITDDRDIRVTK
jgi:hypothetical protein|tara:strand:- start:176 stop:379 length:204 start_codon:yes stop_codon:yes gene_type:complete